MSNQPATFEALIKLFDSPVSNTGLRINDQRRAVILQALRIAEQSGQAVEAFRTSEPAFNLNTLNFGSRYIFGQLRGGPMEFTSHGADARIAVLVDCGLVTAEHRGVHSWQARDGIQKIFVTLTPKGEKAAAQ